MARLYFVCLFLFIGVVCTKESDISDIRQCADPNCSIAVSEAETLLRYSSSDHLKLSFGIGEKVKVYSKSAGKRKDLWGVEIKGKRGYVPKDLIREKKILVRTDKIIYEVPTEIHSSSVNPISNVLQTVDPTELSQTPVPSINDDLEISENFKTPAFGVAGVSADTVENDSPNVKGVSEPYEVIQGTTLYLNTNGDSSESKPVQATATDINIQPSKLAETFHEAEVINVQNNKLDKPNASLILPNAATSSVDRAEQDVNKEDRPEQEKGKADVPPAESKRSEDNILNFVSSLIKGSDSVGGNGETHAKIEIEEQEDAQDEESGDDDEEDDEVDDDEEEDDEEEEEEEEDIVEEDALETAQEISQVDVKTPPAPEVKDDVKSVSESVHGDADIVSMSPQEAVTVDLRVEENKQSQTQIGDATQTPLDIQSDQSNLQSNKTQEVTNNEGPVVPVDNSTEESLVNLSVNNGTADEKNVTSDDSFENVNDTVAPENTEAVVEDVVKEVTEEVEPVDVNFHQDEELKKNEQLQVESNSEHMQSVKMTQESNVDASNPTITTTSQGEDREVKEDTSHVNVDRGGNSQVNIMQKQDETISMESVPQVTTEDSSIWVSEPVPYVQDDAVTESYSSVSTQGTENIDLSVAEGRQESEVSSAEKVNEENLPEDYSADNASEIDKDSTKSLAVDSSAENIYEEAKEIDQPETEEFQGFFSGFTSSLSSGYESLLQIVIGPSKEEEIIEPAKNTEPPPSKEEEDAVSEEDIRKKEARDEMWSSLWTSPTESQGHVNGDHLVSKSAAAAACDSGHCEVEPGTSPVGEQAPGSPQYTDIPYQQAMHEQKGSFDTLMFLVVTAVTVLFFTLGYYYIEKRRRDGSLVAKINSLEKALMVSSKENFILKDNLEETKEKLTSMEISSSSGSGEEFAPLKAELEELKAVRSELEEQVMSLEKELEAATEAGLELNLMLAESLSAQHGSDTIMKSVEHLQKQLDSQQDTISTMTSSLSTKSMENESLQADLNIASESIKTLEEEIQKMNQNLSSVQKEKQDMEHEFQQKSQTIETQLVEALESKSAESQRLCRELDALQDVLDETRRTLTSRDGELAVLRDCLRHTDEAGGGDAENKLEALMDVGHARAELSLAIKERDGLQEKLQGEEEARKLLEDHVRIVSEEVASLRGKYREAEREKTEAQMRLEVLSNYFKEKETQLQKELGLQEAMCIQKEGDAMSTFERIKSLQEEVESYKSQNETLKKEIVDQERGLKSQIATLEKKVHENWVVARQAERKLEESKQESGQLRNRLTLVERNLINTSQNSDTPKLNDRVPGESNGELPTSPLPMGLEDLPSSPLHYGHPSSPPLLPPSGQPLPPFPFPLPGMFMPPPPPGLPFMSPIPPGPFPGDRRPPPLGRMSSPPPEPRGGFSPYDHSPPLSPPRRPYRSPPRYDNSPERYRHHSPPSQNSHPPPFSPYAPPPMWDDRNGPRPRSSFRPLRRESPREPKAGSTLSSGHSSESLDKSSRHSGRV